MSYRHNFLFFMGIGHCRMVLAATWKNASMLICTLFIAATFFGVEVMTYVRMLIRPGFRLKLAVTTFLWMLSEFVWGPESVCR